MKRVKKWNFQVEGEWDESQENDFSWMVSCKNTYVFALLRVQDPSLRDDLKKKSKLRDFVPFSINPSPPTIKRDILIREIF